MTKIAGLFEGVGMFTRAALALGCELAWSVEIDDWNRTLLELRYPGALHLKDVREVGEGLPEVDGFVLGFPCQDISNAGRREGISGKRSGLWGEAARLIGIYQPKWVVIENVSALKRRGLNTVLDDLYKLGYDATWDCIPALAVGAPHIRDRIWIVATKAGTVVAPAMFPAWEHGSLPKELPRAGTMTQEGVFYGTPRAEVGACKKAVNRGRPLFPTPEASDGTGGRVSAEVGGQRPSGSKRSVTLATAVAHDTVRTPSARDWKDTGDGRMGRGQLPEAVRDDRSLYPTPMAADGDRMSEQGVRFYQNGTDNPTLLGAARRADAEEVWPTPCVADAAGGRRTKGKDRPDEGGLEKTVHQREQGELFPTPAANDHKGDVVSHLRNKHGWDGGERSRITSLEVLAKNDFQQPSPEQIEEARTTPPAHGKRVETWPTPHGFPKDGQARNPGPSGNELGRAVNEAEGTTLLDAVSEVEGIMWPTPAARDGDQRGASNPIRRREMGRSVQLPDAVERPNGERQAKGALNPDWVEWLMGVPVGWTNPDCEQPVQLDWSSEYGVPRTATDVPHRRARLTAIGNALVWQVALIPIKEAMDRA